MAGRVEIIDCETLPRPKESGSVAVVIPAHNSEARVGGVINNLAHQPLPDNQRLQVVVCANACNDATAVKASRALDHLVCKTGADAELIVTDIPGQANALNRMVERVGDGHKYVIELQDDSFPSMGAIGLLSMAMESNDGLGAMGVANRPIPTYRGRRGMRAEKVAFANQMMLRPGDKVIIDRVCAFRPEVVGSFPDIVSVDCYMMRQALVNSQGYGVLRADQAQVYHRIPSTFEDLVKQRKMYVRGWRQISKEIPDYNEVVGKATEGFGLSKKEKILRLLTLSGVGISMFDKLGAVGLYYLNRYWVRQGDGIGVYNSSERDRVWSSV